MDFEKLRSDPRATYLVGVALGFALGLVVANRLRIKASLEGAAVQAKPHICPECERTNAQRHEDQLRAWVDSLQARTQTPGLAAEVKTQLDSDDDALAKVEKPTGVFSPWNRKHADKCHCNICIGAPAGMPSEDVIYATE